MRKSKLLTKHATKMEKGVYLGYLLGQNIAFQVTLVVLTIYWQSTLGIEPAIVGTIMLIARVWDGINDPILGGVVQKVGKNRFGMYKPWTLVSAFLLPLIVFMIFTAPFGAESTGTVVWAALSYIIFGMVYTLTDIPIFSLSMTMEPNAKRRVKLLFLGRIGAGLAGIVASLIFFGITDATTNSLGSLNAFLLAGGVAAIIALCTMIPIFITKERNIISTNKEITLKNMFRSLSSNKHLLKLILCFFFGGLFNMMFMASLPYFVSEFVTNGNATLIMTLNATLALIVTFGLMLVVGKLGAKKTMFIFEFIGLIFLIMGALIAFYNRNQYNLLIMMLGANLITNTPLTVVMGKLTQETIEYGHYHSGERQEALGFAAQTFTAKVMIGVGQFIASGVMALCGFVSKLDDDGNAIAQVDGVMSNIFWATTGLLAASAILVMFLYGFWYNLRTKDVQVMVAANRHEITKAEAEKILAKQKRTKQSIFNWKTK